MIQVGGTDPTDVAKGGGVMKYVGFAVKAIVIVVGLLFLLISLPAAPIIIYLTILFNVIKLMWGRLKEL
jgi:hypothetical protein